jgi:hypothetical protein
MSPEPTATPNPNGGPCTPEGRAISSRNAITYGLFATRDFIRPGESETYDEFAKSLEDQLAPRGMLELNLADEIRRAMWRLRRCSQIEEGFSGTNEDPMQQEPQPDSRSPSIEHAPNPTASSTNAPPNSANSRPNASSATNPSMPAPTSPTSASPTGPLSAKTWPASSWPTTDASNYRVWPKSTPSSPPRYVRQLPPSQVRFVKPRATPNAPAAPAKNTSAAAAETPRQP